MLDRHRRIHAQWPAAVWSNSDVDTVAPVTITRRPVERGRIPRGAVRASDGVDHPRLTSARIHDQLAKSTCTSDVHTDGLALAPRGSDLHSHNAVQQQPWSHRPPRRNRQGRAPPSRLRSTKAQCTKRISSRPSTRPADNGTTANELASCNTRANAGSRIVTNAATLNPRQSVHIPPASRVKRRLSDPLTPSLHSDGRRPYAGLA
jgi:hypothetical protein